MDRDTARVWVTALTVSDGTTLDVPKSGVLLFVGPNNSGKSRSLKDIQGLARSSGPPHYVPRAIINAKIHKNTDIDLRTWVEENLPSVAVDGIPRYHIAGWSQVSAEDIVGSWNQERLDVLTGLFIMFADGSGRLNVGHAEASFDMTVAPPTSPNQRAYQDPDLEKEIAQKCKDAFGFEVVVDRFAGNVIPLRVGDPPEFEHEAGRPTKNYLEQLKALPKLEEQGDGVRSYMGLVLTMLAGHHDIIIVDEPEAFLHPPQARLLARVLADRAENQQVFLATHSSSIVQGALEAGGAITIVRMTREGTVNHAAVLEHQAVKDLWSDPLLRYSNVLDGLFHDAVVLCESDSDCRYYQAVLDNLDDEADRQQESERKLQLLFTHCGGKGRMPSVVKALKAVSVPVIVVADFDFLRDQSDIERLVVEVGGEYDQVDSDVKILDAALTSDSKPLRKSQLRQTLLDTVDEIQEEVLRPRDGDRLRALIRTESGWDKAKRSGVAAVPQGDAYRACDRLLKRLKEWGILVVPVGELEGFERSVGGHGPAWVAEVLSQALHRSPSSEAVDFVKSIRDTCQKLAD